MEIQDIVPAHGMTELSGQKATMSTSGNADFGNYLLDEINTVNNKIVNADNNVADMAMGKNGNIHEVMLSISEAKLSLQMMMEVRNKVLESLQEIMRMQV